MISDNATYRNLMLELRRGTLVLCVLSRLKEPEYGYSLVQSLQEKGLEVEQNTLYPLLRRLESQGLLESSWSTEEPRPRKYYTLSPLGRKMLEALKEEWRNMTLVIEDLLELKKGGALHEGLD